MVNSSDSALSTTVESCGQTDGQTDTTIPYCVLRMHFVQRTHKIQNMRGGGGRGRGKRWFNFASELQRPDSSLPQNVQIKDA
jgi:hypothetical protein